MCVVSQGHYGEVYKGYYTDDGGNDRRVAVKRLKAKMYEKFAADFEKEVKIMMGLSHPNVVQIIGQCPQKDPRKALVFLALLTCQSAKLVT